MSSPESVTKMTTEVFADYSIDLKSLTQVINPSRIFYPDIQGVTRTTQKAVIKISTIFTA